MGLEIVCFLLFFSFLDLLGTRQRYIISKTIHHLEFISVFAIAVQLSCVWVPYLYVQNILSSSALTCMSFYVDSCLMVQMWNLHAYYGLPSDALNGKPILLTNFEVMQVFALLTVYAIDF